MTTSRLPLTIQLLKPEGSVAQGGAVGLAADGPDLAGQAHHGRLDVEECQIYRLRLLSAAVMGTRIGVCDRKILLKQTFRQISKMFLPQEIPKKVLFSW